MAPVLGDRVGERRKKQESQRAWPFPTLVTGRMEVPLTDGEWVSHVGVWLYEVSQHWAEPTGSKVKFFQNKKNPIPLPVPPTSVTKEGRDGLVMQGKWTGLCTVTLP
jgi:hypothetical protein